MVDVSKVTYTVIAFTEKGLQLDITQAVESLGWEEGEDELAMKITFELYNAKYNGTRLSSLIKIGCKVGVKANWGSGKGVVALGNIVEWTRNTTKSDEIFSILAYDNLYAMQRSQDNVYFEKGKSTKSALSSIFSSWGITLASYTGPNVSHAKILYKNAYLGDIVRDILKEAKDKGGGKGIVRCTEGKVSVIKVGGNTEIYHLESNNAISTKHKWSITDMVTRVKIVSSEKKEGLPKVEATVNGKTKYGVFQKIVTHGKSDKLSEAKEEANQILKDEGEPQETCTVQAPDVPPVRKGDMISIKAGSLSGLYIIQSIQHNADSGKMTMQVLKHSSKDAGSNEEKPQKDDKEETKYRVIARSGLNLRTGPNQRIIGTMPYGTTITSDEEKNGGWLHVCWNGTWGWAYKQYLTSA